MSKKLLSKKNTECKICNINCSNVGVLTKHIKKEHNLDQLTYTINHLLNGEIPKCLCGCEKPVKVYNYSYND